MSSKLETRVTALERELATLKAQVENPKLPWWKANIGQFADDPIYDEAMKLGRAVRTGSRSDSKDKSPRKAPATDARPVRSRRRFVVKPKAMNLRLNIKPAGFNQLADQLEVETFVTKPQRESR